MNFSKAPVAVLAALTIVVFAQEATAAGVTVLGSGTISCGKWIEQSRASPSSLPLAIGWVAGYLTRASISTNRDLLAAPDASALRAWIDNYCLAHPLDTLFNAVEELEGELVSRTAPIAK